MAVSHCKDTIGGKKIKNQKQALHKKHRSTQPTSVVIGAISLFMLDCLPKCQPICFPLVAFFFFHFFSPPPHHELSVIKSYCLLVSVPSGWLHERKRKKTWGKKKKVFCNRLFLTSGERSGKRCLLSLKHTLGAGTHSWTLHSTAPAVCVCVCVCVSGHNESN